MTEVKHTSQQLPSILVPKIDSFTESNLLALVLHPRDQVKIRQEIETQIRKEFDFFSKKCKRKRRMFHRIPIDYWPDMMRRIFLWCDQMTLHGMLGRNLLEQKWQVQFQVNARRMKTIGNCTKEETVSADGHRSRSICISVSQHSFLSLFSRHTKKHVICGIPVFSQLESLIVILQHEMMHTLMFALGYDTRGHNAVYKKLASNLFGHT